MLLISFFRDCPTQKWVLLFCGWSIAAVPSLCFAQDAALGSDDTPPSAKSPLDATLPSAVVQTLEQINEADVSQTVKFLASDELEGRDTMSPGFAKAADYVVERFKRAGLKPADGKSFFHVTAVDTTQTPTQDITLTDDQDNALPHFGMLSGGAEAMEWMGPVKQVKLKDKFSEKNDVKVALLKFDSPETELPSINQLVRASNLMRAAGITALIVQVPEDSDLVQFAKRQQAGPSLSNDRLRFLIPVLLVGAEANLSDGVLVNLKLPAQEMKKSNANNVVAVLPGSDPTLAQEFVLFSAHLDHLPMKDQVDAGEDGIFNGADDNASGVTAVLTLADAYARLPVAPKRSVAFICFWGEERGLLGSKQFAATPTIPLEKIISNINIEMIGRPEAGAGGKIWVTGWEKSNLGSLMNDASQKIGITIFEHPQFSSMLYQRSDNYSFAAKGVIAHSFSAGSLHQDYHKVTDEADRLNVPHMTEVIKGLFVGSLPLAEGEVTPHQ